MSKLIVIDFRGSSTKGRTKCGSTRRSQPGVTSSDKRYGHSRTGSTNPRFVNLVDAMGQYANNLLSIVLSTDDTSLRMRTNFSHDTPLGELILSAFCAGMNELGMHEGGAMAQCLLQPIRHPPGFNFTVVILNPCSVGDGIIGLLKHIPHGVSVQRNHNGTVNVFGQPNATHLARVMIVAYMAGIGADKPALTIKP